MLKLNNIAFYEDDGITPILIGTDKSKTPATTVSILRHVLLHPLIGQKVTPENAPLRAYANVEEVAIAGTLALLCKKAIVDANNDPLLVTEINISEEQYAIAKRVINEFVPFFTTAVYGEFLAQFIDA